MEAALGAARGPAADLAVALPALVVLLALLPGALVLALLVTLGRRLFLRTLRRRHPALSFEQRSRVSAAMDSAHSQGLATALLGVRGSLPRDRLCALLQERLVERLAADGAPAFPHLRLTLDARWGRYAWRLPDAPFDLQRHVLETTPTWRGRPVDAFNVQEYVNSQAGKHLPAGHPPWQVALMPAGERTYVLARVHLALLAADELSLGQFVPLESPPPPAPPSPPSPPSPPAAPALLGEDDELPPKPEEASSVQEKDAPVVERENWDSEGDPPLVPPPAPPLVALPALANAFRSAAVGALRGLLALDPARRVDAPGDFFRWWLALLVTFVLVVTRASGDPKGLRAAFLWAAPGSAARALHPATVARRAAAAAWAACVWAGAVAPLLALREAALLAAGRGRHTAAGAAAAGALLAAGGARELAALLARAAAAPRAALAELHAAYGQSLSELQAVSLCGRKALAWSAPVPAQTLRRARERSAAACGAARARGDVVALAALARALDVYFSAAALPRPDAVPATARALPLAAALARGPHRRAGWLCLALPTGEASEGWERAAAATRGAAHGAQRPHAPLRARRHVPARGRARRRRRGPQGAAAAVRLRGAGGVRLAPAAGQHQHVSGAGARRARPAAGGVGGRAAGAGARLPRRHLRAGAAPRRGRRRHRRPGVARPLARAPPASAHRHKLKPAPLLSSNSSSLRPARPRSARPDPVAPDTSPQRLSCPRCPRPVLTASDPSSPCPALFRRNRPVLAVPVPSSQHLTRAFSARVDMVAPDSSSQCPIRPGRA